MRILFADLQDDRQAVEEDVDQCGGEMFAPLPFQDKHDTYRIGQA